MIDRAETNLDETTEGRGSRDLTASAEIPAIAPVRESGPSQFSAPAVDGTLDVSPGFPLPRAVCAPVVDSTPEAKRIRRVLSYCTPVLVDTRRHPQSRPRKRRCRFGNPPDSRCFRLHPPAALSQLFRLSSLRVKYIADKRNRQTQVCPVPRAPTPEPTSRRTMRSSRSHRSARTHLDSSKGGLLTLWPLPR